MLIKAHSNPAEAHGMAATVRTNATMDGTRPTMLSAGRALGDLPHASLMSAILFGDTQLPGVRRATVPCRMLQPHLVARPAPAVMQMCSASAEHG